MSQKGYIEEIKPRYYEGYTFKGWYKDDLFNEPFNISQDIIEKDIILYAKWDKHQDDFKVLTIGNSFSEDAFQYLAEVLEYQQTPSFTIGHLMIGGSSLETHYNNALDDQKVYAYIKNENGKKTVESNQGLAEKIKETDWNVIIIQQVSGLSGKKTSYDPYLRVLVEYIKQQKTNPYAEVIWHMTWAYQADSTYAQFDLYQRDQMKMYQDIVDTVKSQIIPMESIAAFIPVGTAIQNMRTSFVGDTLTRDGYHLSRVTGRLIASLCWYIKITGQTLTIQQIPDLVDEETKLAIAEAINHAMKEPMNIVESSYKTQS